MPVPNVVIGSRTNGEKVLIARELRRGMTRAERILWRALKANRYEALHFRRQQVISGFIVDFYCHAASLILEVDGPIHDRQREADAYRDAVFLAQGLRILRVSNDEVLTDLDGVLDSVWSAIISESATSTSPFPLREGDRG